MLREINLHKDNEIFGVRGVVHKFPDEKMEKGVARISKYDFSTENDPLYNVRDSLQTGGLFRMYDGKYVRLVVNNELMMSDTAMERKTNRHFIDAAKGRVLIAGLGIGLILEAILDKKQVTEVVVIEKYQDVIDLVHPIFQHKKLQVICADIFEYDMPKTEKFDCIYFDIWADICEDNLKEMTILHRKYRKNKATKDSFMASWMREFLQKQRARERYS